MADTTHVIHRSNQLDELIPNMYDTGKGESLKVTEFEYGWCKHKSQIINIIRTFTPFIAIFSRKVSQ